MKRQNVTPKQENFCQSVTVQTYVKKYPYAIDQGRCFSPIRLIFRQSDG